MVKPTITYKDYTWREYPDSNGEMFELIRPGYAIAFFKKGKEDYTCEMVGTRWFECIEEEDMEMVNILTHKFMDMINLNIGLED